MLWCYLYCELTSGVRQSGVLSTYLFAVYIDDLIIDVVRQSGGCTFHFVSVCIVVYADDFNIVSSFCGHLTTACEVVWSELTISFELAINLKKSICTTIGPRFNAPFTNIVTSDGMQRSSIRYLGVFIIWSRISKCFLQHAKQSFSEHSVRFMVE